MQNEWELTSGTPYPLGVSVYQDKLNFAAVMNTGEECGILLYSARTGRQLAKLAFHEKDRKGNIRYGAVYGIEPQECLYNFYVGKREFADPYAKAVRGREKLYSAFLEGEGAYDWSGDAELRIPYRDSIFYLLHVRGFTKHASSGVEHRGTFQGIIEKIPYLKELGVTTLELMPAYEFDGYTKAEPEELPAYMRERYKELQQSAGSKKSKTDYWGYRKGLYFAPKRSYAATERPDLEFKDMVKALHRNGLEVILQFYFPREVKQGFILEVLKYWVLEYHIDGIHVKGERVPITLLATDPLFANVKLLHHELPLADIYEPGEQPVYKNLAYYQDDFMYDARKFLKGDDNQLAAFAEHMRKNSRKAGYIRFITNYYGFTLADLVSYDRKHNEENGEENRDGTDYNYSWNCGAEGGSRKKAVKELRLRQMKNAMFLVLFSQGTPLLRAGDELMHTQNGNNNAYCQDNGISWLHWDKTERQQEREFLEFVKELIALRKSHPVLRREEACAMSDTLACGFPDLSYHGEEAWKPGFENYRHQIGMLYYGGYVQGADHTGDDSVYLAFNMHWQTQQLALPKLPDGEKWELALSTARENQLEKKEKTAQEKVRLAPRSCAVLIGGRKTGQPGKKE